MVDIVVEYRKSKEESHMAFAFNRRLRYDNFRKVVYTIKRIFWQPKMPFHLANISRAPHHFSITEIKRELKMNSAQQINCA